MAKTKQMYYRMFETTVDNVFRVTKLDPDYEVLESYTVDLNIGRKRMACNCPSWKVPCKHYKMVQRFVTIGMDENVVFNSISQEFEEFLNVL